MASYRVVADSNSEVDDLHNDDLLDLGLDLDVFEENQATDQLIRNANRLKKTRRSRTIAIVGYCIIGFLAFILLIRNLRRSHQHPILQDVHLDPEYFREAGSKRIMIRYGPFTVPGRGQNNGMKGFKVEDAKTPCDGCLITWMQAGLEYTDGTFANADNGMWLHHTVLSNTERSAVKACKKKRGGERFFASGNEKTVLDLTLNGTEKIGYRLGKSENVKMIMEFMNELEEPRDAVLTITYEYIPDAPADFEALTPLWLDIGECQGSEVPVPKGAVTFEPTSPVWTSTINGHVMNAISHLHDGGIHLHVTRNNETVCTSTAIYSHGSHGSMDAMPGMSQKHISFMPPCYNMGRINSGEEWAVNAHYDFDAHSPMLDGNGNVDGVMGIAILYVAEDS